MKIPVTGVDCDWANRLMSSPAASEETNSGQGTASQTLQCAESPQSSDAVPPEIRNPRPVSWVAQVLVGLRWSLIAQLHSTYRVGDAGDLALRHRGLAAWLWRSLELEARLQLHDVGRGGGKGSGELAKALPYQSPSKVEIGGHHSEARVYEPRRELSIPTLESESVNKLPVRGTLTRPMLS